MMTTLFLVCSGVAACLAPPLSVAAQEVALTYYRNSGSSAWIATGTAFQKGPAPSELRPSIFPQGGHIR